MLFDSLEILFFLFLLVSLVPLVGTYMYKIFKGERTFLHPILHPLEKITYRLSGINPVAEMNWRGFLKALLIFNLFGAIALFLIQTFQYYLPLNPEGFTKVPWPLALNTTISFVTNTNWQAYSGETTLSYFTQMCGLTVQNFLSAATGQAVLLALIRGITRKKDELGNFWVDIVRTIIYVLLPLAFVLALFVISQGGVQSLSRYLEVTTLENGNQIIPLGPVASQVAIKLIGSNGGGFFGTNSAHPFENPNALANFFELLALILIPASSTYFYGLMIGSRKHGWLLFFTMFVLWIGGIIIACLSEYQNNPLLNAVPFLEGKEVRLGVMNSILWGVSTSATSNGAVNGMLSSFSPLAGGVALFNLMLGAVIFGGIGVGMCSMVMLVLLTLFLAGLMVGRTPEYMGKKIEIREMQWVSVAILTPAALILIGSTVVLLLPSSEVSLGNRGPHGLTEILYAFSSAASNNGSAFASLKADTLFFNLALAACMLLGRLATIVPSLAIAGSFAQKRSAPPSVGAFSANTLLFAILLAGDIVVIGALTYFPALSLGPIVEQILMLRGVSF